MRQLTSARRIGAFLILFLLIIANLTVVSRIPPMPRSIKPAQYLAPFQEKAYLLTTIAAMVFVLGLFLPINYIQAQAVELGMDPSLAKYLIPILNATRYVLYTGGTPTRILTFSQLVRSISPRIRG